MYVQVCLSALARRQILEGVPDSFGYRLNIQVIRELPAIDPPITLEYLVI